MRQTRSYSGCSDSSFFPSYMGDDLIEHYDGFTIKVALTKHRSSDRWTGDFTLIQNSAAGITYGPYYGRCIFATREEAKQAVFASARAEIDQIPTAVFRSA